jgi:hypothetical protein
MSAVKIGSEPRISAPVEAVVRERPSTNATWLSQIPSTAASSSSGRSWRRIASEPSSAYASAATMSAAAP